MFDEVKNENVDLGKMVKLLEEDIEILKSKSSVCDVACSIEDLVCSAIASVEDEHKKPFASMYGKSYVDNNECLKNNIGLKIMHKMGFQGSGLGKHGQGMKEPIQSIWRPRYTGLGFGKCESE